MRPAAILERSPSRAHRQIDVADSTGGDIGEDLAVGGVDRRERPPGHCVLELTIDKNLGAETDCRSLEQIATADSHSFRSTGVTDIVRAIWWPGARGSD